MCGAVAAVATQRGASSGASVFARHGLYQLGRLVAYLVLGALAGQVGAWLNVWSSGTGWQRLGAWVSFVVMALWAVTVIAPSVTAWWRQRRPDVASSRLAGGTRVGGFSRVVALAARLPSSLRAGLLGLATGLLPCGWLYGFVAMAVGTGSALSGALLLGAFWLGAVPVLSGASVLVSRLGARARGLYPAVAALVLLVVGGYNLLSRDGFAAHQMQGATDARDAPRCH